MTSIINGPAGKQNYGTPRVFLDAVEARFGPISCDLAAEPSNAVCPRFLGEKQNSLTVDWHLFDGNLWLNPPFKRIAPWAEKCAEESALGAKILFLVPASVGCNWYWEHVHGKAFVLPITPRLTFDGTPPNPKTGKPDPFPKDLILCAYGWPPGFERWAWRSPKLPHP